MTPNPIDKIRKLLALGQSSNEHEANAALAAAHKLMLEHKIEACALEQAQAPKPDEPIASWDDPLHVATKVSTWRTRLAMVLAQANGCKIILRGGSICIIGAGSNVGTVRYLFAYAESEIERLAKAQSGNGRTWINNYRIGCTEGLQLKLQEAQEATIRDLRSHSTGASLVRLNTAIEKVSQESARVEAWADSNMRLRKQRATPQRFEPSARERGRSDGRTISLSQGAGLSTGTRKAL